MIEDNPSPASRELPLHKGAFLFMLRRQLPLLGEFLRLAILSLSIPFQSAGKPAVFSALIY